MYTRSFVALGVLFLTAVGCRDDSPSALEPPAPQPAVAAAATLSFRQLSAGWQYTCGVTTDDRAYCWGNEFPGTLGNGSGGMQFCMDAEECITQPVAVLGDLRFRNVSSGNGHTCGVTSDGRGYCWGNNSSGQLGIGTNAGPELCDGNESLVPCSSRPLAVRGGLRFRSLTVGSSHTCGLTTDSLAYCWGNNSVGQLGDGTTIDWLTPRAVAGGRRFRQLSAGLAHTCGLTTDDRAYCWGSNNYGQLGDSTQVAARLRPVRVAGGRRFRQLDAGMFHTCAIASSYRAFCWGKGDYGQLGTGRTLPKSFWPRGVAGGLTLDRVTAGDTHTCGEATNNRAYCWGRNFYGELGDGTTTQRLSPVAVTGGLFFSQLTAGDQHTCGRTSAAVAYCWGHNWRGQLGDGTTDARLTPTPVAGVM